MLANMFQLFLSRAITLPKVHLGQKLLNKQAFLTCFSVAASASLSWHIYKVALIRTSQDSHTLLDAHYQVFPAAEVCMEYVPVSSGNKEIKVHARCCCFDQDRAAGL